MNSAASNAVLIGIDWGTSSLRAYLIDEKGDVIDKISSAQGIINVKNQAFKQVLERLISPWVSESDLPILASGMISSRNGWVETPYLHLPIDANGLANSLLRHNLSENRSIYFVTGASNGDYLEPDVMRGEETQIVAASSIGLVDGTFVLPGTHSKWIQVKNGKIANFSTYMTGEIFGALKENTILGAMMEDSEFDEEIFRNGVAVGFNGADKLLNRLFHVRTLSLFGKLSKTSTADYMSGILIGAEVASNACRESRLGTISIIGDSDLVIRYKIAIKYAGLKSQIYSGDIVAKGHFLIAKEAGLLT